MLITEEKLVTTSCGVPGFSLELDRVIKIKSIEGTKRLPERLQFEMEKWKKAHLASSNNLN